MGNMSYCRFENTVRDMNDCLESLQDGEYHDMENVSKSERFAMQEMLDMLEDLKWELEKLLA